MTRDLIIVGGGGFGREVVDVVCDVNREAPVRGEAPWNLLGVVDDHLSDVNATRLREAGVAHLGAISDVVEQLPGRAYVVGIGDPAVRARVARRFEAAGFHAATLVHPSVTIGSQCRIGEGSVLCAGARVTTNVALGRHVHLNPNVTVGHDSTLEDFVSVNPQGAISGSCIIEEGVLVGAQAVVLQGLTVHANATIGAAACVVRDVDAGAVVKGVPAR